MAYLPTTVFEHTRMVKILNPLYRKILMRAFAALFVGCQNLKVLGRLQLDRSWFHLTERANLPWCSGLAIEWY